MSSVVTKALVLKGVKGHILHNYFRDMMVKIETSPKIIQ